MQISESVSLQLCFLGEAGLRFHLDEQKKTDVPHDASRRVQPDETFEVGLTLNLITGRMTPCVATRETVILRSNRYVVGFIV